MPDLNIIRKMNQPENIALTKHARERLSERNIKIVDIVHGFKTGEIIKHYEDDKPLPSCLILGKSENGDYLHIVVSNDKEYIYLITAYYPSADRWEEDMKTRKER